MRQPDTPTPNHTYASSLNQSDADMARVLEDLIELLISRGVIQLSELPQAAQEKLQQRKQTRLEMSQQLKLIPDEDEDNLFT